MTQLRFDVPVTYPTHLRRKARELRREQNLTIDELADRLAVSRTTVYNWVRDLPIPSSRLGGGFADAARRKGNRAMRNKYRRIREEAYELGRWEFVRLSREPLFREFVCLYIAEGYKRSRHTVSVANSDPAAIALAVHWIKRVSRKELIFSIQFHADQNLERLRERWAEELSIPNIQIRFQRKTNSGELAHRSWRSEFGVLTVLVHDTYCRMRVQGWVDRMKREWLDSVRVGA